MKLELTHPAGTRPVSCIEFNDNVIKEIVSFWANIRYQSPQFPLDFTPNINQLETLYENGNIPQISTEESTTFKVTSDDLDIHEHINIIQLRLNFVGPSKNTIPSEEDWGQCFDTTVDKWVFTPDGSAYISPSNDSNQDMITLKVTSQDSGTPKYFSYCVMVSFQIGETTYFGNFDPYVKVTSSSTNA